MQRKMRIRWFERRKLIVQKERLQMFSRFHNLTQSTSEARDLPCKLGLHLLLQRWHALVRRWLGANLNWGRLGMATSAGAPDSVCHDLESACETFVQAPTSAMVSR